MHMPATTFLTQGYLRPMQVESASLAHSIMQYSPNMSELLGFVPTPKTGGQPAAAEQPPHRPSVASSYSFGVCDRPGTPCSAQSRVPTEASDKHLHIRTAVS